MRTKGRHWRYFVAALTLMMCSSNVVALDLLHGVYYFDNSQQRFQHVKLVAGDNSTPRCRVFDLSEQEGKLWKLNVEEDYNNFKYYIWINSDIASGDYEVPFDAMLASLSSEAGFKCTLTQSVFAFYDPYAGEPSVFCPLFDTKNSDGYWRPLSSYSVGPSGTVPIINITTQDSVSISSRDYYINASLWLDNCGIDGYESIGSEANPVPLEIKGRGNWSWSHSFKRPYRLKFATKHSPLGLDNSRHFVLLANNEDYSGYLRNTTGFALSRLAGMPYTPSLVPVELIINGQYMGIYFLCEKIRIENGRVDIMEQNDMEEDPDNATGGWLLELSDKGETVISQHQGNDSNNPVFSFVSDSPEVLSSVQRNYIHDLIFRTDSCIYVSNKNDTAWEQYLDINSVARFYIIHEIMENVEAFSGSLYMYKDLGWDEKLRFGPVWDFDNSFFQDGTTSDHFIFDYGKKYSFLWIKELLKFPHFQRAIRMAWKELMNNNPVEAITINASQWRETIGIAEAHDKQRWPFYASSHASYKPAEYIDVISRKVAWLDARWGTNGDVNLDGVVNSVDITAIYNYILFGNTKYYSTSDVNQDGTVNAVDITAIYNIILAP